MLMISWSLIGSNPTEISRLITQLRGIFALKDLGEMSYFLGLEVHKISNTVIQLSQAKYVKEILTKAGMLSTKSMPTPMLSGQKLSVHSDAAFDDPSLCRSIVGSL